MGGVGIDLESTTDKMSSPNLKVEKWHFKSNHFSACISFNNDFWCMPLGLLKSVQ